MGTASTSLKVVSATVWMATTCQLAAALFAQPAALVAFLLALLIVVTGGSALVFIVKGGTVAMLVDAEQSAGPIDGTPVRWTALERFARFSIERFTAACARLFRRYLALGALLAAVYATSAGVYLLAVLGGFRALRPGSELTQFALTLSASTALVVWITLINLVDLMAQMVIAATDRGVWSALREVLGFFRAEFRAIAGVFALVLLLVVLATAASIALTAGLGLIAFVPLAGLAVLPLQLFAWFLRNLVFQYLGLTALAAYLNVYRSYRAGSASVARPAG